ncbi:NTP transferase domain-containing protein [Mucilaginibacter ginkgonis]|uniref:Probable molybdenum cofactor guanylyltransferase n=1 Tax=Mucilaginibacter ginkgonis TaxID=2682091 RepID=A0A7T7FCB3_9SPHI|nr:NTP transferase domain-containing protein [Mucilaginibacter ginkgonis]QQL50495.1 NTP transferase domain-containing protein [Mucilaginibacter ginkgonis]
MTTRPAEQHRKHEEIARADLGEFGRLELAIYGAPCYVIRQSVEAWADILSEKFKLAFADESHNKREEVSSISISYTKGIQNEYLNQQQPFNSFDRHAVFNNADLVLVNGNHFNARKQVVIIHPDKSLYGKTDKLTDAILILLSPGQVVPDFISKLVDGRDVPVLSLDDEAGIGEFLVRYIEAHVAPVYGLVLAGGKSTRMHTDKGAIAYHGKSQRAHSYDLLSEIVDEVFISGAAEDGYPIIADTFLGLGPLGGIVSAMQQNPDAAWLTIACDLPYLTEDTLRYLTQNRDPSKTATAFLDSEGKFPEPLITIWEPRAYPRMLQFLSQGYSCPRKVLINSDVKLLAAPDVSEFRNINHPSERDEALRFFGSL